ncbi:hypothetical protein A0H76_1128 [Hepatospora eriocheir]|uniref:Uncharacterized protein n=1 Tax=Hepatospora eriocheir TaxID=1081669 RepID=A0A1X0QHN8_9MICR|nr:hypothetical protein A0H76_1128 [Hepatospora eriocheir]
MLSRSMDATLLDTTYIEIFIRNNDTFVKSNAVLNTKNKNNIQWWKIKLSQHKNKIQTTEKTKFLKKED